MKKTEEFLKQLGIKRPSDDLNHLNVLMMVDNIVLRFLEYSLLK